MNLPKHLASKLMLLAMLAISLAGAGGGWWYQQSLQRRPIQLWGHEAATLMLRAPTVELWRLKPVINGEPASIRITAQGDAFEADKRIDVSRAPGFLHLRHSLLSDYSFDWSDSASGKRDWRYALRFADKERTATVLFSGDFHYALLVETGAAASIQPIAAGVEKLFDDAKEP
jgi:hypothetical protein